MGLVEGQRYGIDGRSKIWVWWTVKDMGLMEGKNMGLVE